MTPGQRYGSGIMPIGNLVLGKSRLGCWSSFLGMAGDPHPNLQGQIVKIDLVNKIVDQAVRSGTVDPNLKVVLKMLGDRHYPGCDC